MKLTPESNATGWANALNGGGVYYFGSGVVRITVTAKNVDGVKILDWDKDQYRSPEVAANDNKHATITAVFDLGSSGRVVTRFLNPQADAEGIMTVETAPPPRVLAGFTAFLRRWRHGAKADRKHQGLFLHGSHPRRAIMGYRYDSRMGRSQKHFTHTRLRNVCSNRDRGGFPCFCRTGELLESNRDSGLQIQRHLCCNFVCASQQISAGNPASLAHAGGVA